MVLLDEDGWCCWTMMAGAGANAGGDGGGDDGDSGGNAHMMHMMHDGAC